MPYSDAQALRKAAKLLKKTVYSPKVPIKTLRAHYDAFYKRAILPNNIDSREVDVGPVPASFLVPELAVGSRTILYAHGGGFIAGSRASAANLCASLAHESASRLLIPEYRLAPEFPYPTAVEDLYNAYSWLVHQGIPATDIIFAGDGAGANLVLSLIHYLRERRIRLPAAVIAISPWVDLTCGTPAFMARTPPDPLYTRDIMAAQALQYTWHGNFANPNVSPINGDYAQFPPLFIQCGTREILIDDARALAQKASDSGVAVTLDIQEGMWHLFQAIDSLTPRAHLAVRRMGQWVREGFR